MPVPLYENEESRSTFETATKQQLAAPNKITETHWQAFKRSIFTNPHRIITMEDLREEIGKHLE